MDIQDDIRKQIKEAVVALSHHDPRQRVEGIRQITALAKRLPLDERAAAVHVLEQVIEDQEPFVRWNLAIALGEIGHERGILLLERLSGD